MTPQEEAEAIEIELELRRRKEASAPAPSDVAPEVAEAGRSAWKDASPKERAALLLSNFATYAKAPAERALNEAANMGMRAGGPALGQAAGAATGLAAPIAVPLFGAIGGAAGEFGAQLREGGAIRPGAIGGAAVAGLIPGAPLAGATGRRVAGEMVKQGVGNIAAKATETGFDEGRLPTAAEAALAATGAAVGTGLAKSLDKGTNAQTVAAALKRSQDSTRRRTIELGQELGYVLPPSILRPNMVNDAMNSVGGKAAMAQEAALRNQPITNAAVRAELGLNPGESLSVQALNTARLGPNSTYAKLAGVSPQLTVMLDTFKQAQADANMLFTNYRNQFPKNPDILANAKQRQIDADDMVAMMETEAKSHSKGNLIDEFKEARVKLAKIGLAERAMNKGDGNIDASVIGKAYDAGEKMTGNFEKIGRFQNAFGAALREAGKVPPSGVNQLIPMLAGSVGTYGALAGGASGAAAAIPIMLAPRTAREIALSKFFQKQIVHPDYGVTRQDIPAMLAQFGGNSMGR